MNFQKNELVNYTHFFSKDHLVSFFQHYIFDYFQTHAVCRTKDYLDYIFGKNFKLTLAIKVEHNTATIP